MKLNRLNILRKSAGQVAIEYVLVVVIMATVAGLMWMLSQAVVEFSFYGSMPDQGIRMGLERTVSFPWP